MFPPTDSANNAVDMFPPTDGSKDIRSVLASHVETVVLLSHKNTDTHINVIVKFGEGDGKIPVNKIVENSLMIFLQELVLRYNWILIFEGDYYIAYHQLTFAHISKNTFSEGEIHLSL